jgi:large subunit ribosomal protein L11
MISAREVRLVVEANLAKAEPPLGPMLGQHGLNAKDVVKKINDVTSKYNNGILVKVRVMIHKDRGNDVILDGVCGYELIQEVAGDSGYITGTELGNIAKIQSIEMGQDEFALYRSLCGTVKSIGLELRYEG